jgi:hypothetical protein
MDDFDKAFGYLPAEKVEQIRQVAQAIGADVQTIRPFVETKQAVAPHVFLVDRPGLHELRNGKFVRIIERVTIPYDDYRSLLDRRLYQHLDVLGVDAREFREMYKSRLRDGCSEDRAWVETLNAFVSIE